MKLKNLDVIVLYKRGILNQLKLRDVFVYLGDNMTTSGKLKKNNNNSLLYIVRRASMSEAQELLVRKYFIDEPIPKRIKEKVNFIAHIFRKANTPLSEKRQDVTLWDITTSDYVHVIKPHKL